MISAPAPARGLVLASVLALLFVTFLLLHQQFLAGVGSFLVEQEELQPADLIILSYGVERATASHAASLYRNGYAPLILVADFEIDMAGVDTTHSSELMKRQLEREGVPASAIVALAEPVTSTYEEALAVSRWLDTSPHGSSAIVVGQAWRMRRTLASFRRAFSNKLMKLRGSAVNVEAFATNTWWQSRKGISWVANEYPRLFYYFVLGRLAW